MPAENTYQPHWGEKRKHHHHRHRSDSAPRSKGWLGSIKMKDRQAYYGTLLVIIVGVSIGIYYLTKIIAAELRSIPMDDPETEMNVDELRIHKVQEQDALQFSDSLAQAERLDSIRRTVQIDTRAPYRPPRKENKWYITQREWKAIWKDIKMMRWERKHDKEQRERAKENEE